MNTLSLKPLPRHQRFVFPGSCARNRFRSGGFTLVEVTLAIGIISFAFVAMFGMLPVGLNVSRQAMDTTIEAQIVQQLKTQALQTDFKKLGSLGKDAQGNVAPFYFDDQGKVVETSSEAVYKAEFLPVPGETVLPDGSVSKRLATVTILVLNTKGSAERAALDLESAPDAKKFTTLIPDNGL